MEMNMVVIHILLVLFLCIFMYTKNNFRGAAPEPPLFLVAQVNIFS